MCDILWTKQWSLRTTLKKQIGNVSFDLSCQVEETNLHDASLKRDTRLAHMVNDVALAGWR